MCAACKISYLSVQHAAPTPKCLLHPPSLSPPLSCFVVPWKQEKKPTWFLRAQKQMQRNIPPRHISAYYKFSFLKPVPLFSLSLFVWLLYCTLGANACFCINPKHICIWVDQLPSPFCFIRASICSSSVASFPPCSPVQSLHSSSSLHPSLPVSTLGKCVNALGAALVDNIGDKSK